jgi:poly-gamma-glutamate synthesis protein (capsule biosynthesis protein)
MNIAFCGDIMPGGVLPYQDRYLCNDVTSYLGTFDFRVGTLECAIGDKMDFDVSKMNAEMNIIYAREEDLFRVNKFGIDVVSLANNHVFDLGEVGFRNTIDVLTRNGIKYVGAGLNIEEASSPLIIKKNKISVAFFACCFSGLKPVWVTAATPTSAGIWQTDIETVCTRISLAKKEFDYVVVLPHWGVELSYYPPKEYYLYAKRMIDAGADAVLGSHTHTIGPYWKYRNKAICYSMGNFLFPDFCMQVPRPQFYPADKESFKTLERRWFYPKDFTSPVVSVWRGRNRIGSIISMKINDKEVVYKIRLCSLSKDNILSLYTGVNSWVVTLRMMIWRFLYSHFGYDLVNNVLNSKYNYFRRILNRVSAFNIPVDL